MTELSKFVFKPSKNFIFTSKEKKKFVEYEPYKTKSIPKSQKLFSTINPVRPFNRFMKPKKANTGVDPMQIFINFINKDFSKPYKSALSSCYKNDKKDIQIENTKWSLGTTCNCPRKQFLPKMDPYKNYYFIKNDDNKNKNNLRMTYLSTDHISIKTPDMLNTIDFKKIENKKSVLNLKKLNFNSESNSYWVPFIHQDDNNFNRSSVDYNIINYTENKSSGRREATILERSVNNKKKGVTEFTQLQRTFEPNFRPKFAQMFEENNKRFLKYKGTFTQLYDSYNKNGNVYQPFSKSNSNEKINSIKRNNLKIIV
jgi:hypothetical protein